MINELKSATWGQTADLIRKAHVSQLNPDSVEVELWEKAFDALVASIKDERKANPAFAAELSELTEATGFDYAFSDILEEYFDFLEDKEDWSKVVESSEQLVALFKWENAIPSEYMFRKGNALEKQGKYDEAEAFGQEWLDKYPTDLYAAASNVFLKVELKKFDDAEAITEKYLRDDLICDEKTDTFFMAAYRLYEMTDNIYAKQRVEKKMAEYNSIVGNNN